MSCPLTTRWALVLGIQAHDDLGARVISEGHSPVVESEVGVHPIFLDLPFVEVFGGVTECSLFFSERGGVVRGIEFPRFIFSHGTLTVSNVELRTGTYCVEGYDGMCYSFYGIYPRAAAPGI